MQASKDYFFMRRCLQLAAKGEGKVSPNPLVGAVLAKGGKIISEGFHERYGGPHAEANALRNADAEGATLYVSLEPCCQCGKKKKTPPCAHLVISSKVSRVVVATKDPNPCVNGRGIRQIRQAGIRVDVGIMEKEAQRQNEPFFKFITTGKPFVHAKIAQSKDGKIGLKGRGQIAISGQQFNLYCHSLRNRYDAILVGINTILEDDPQLTCRLKGGRNPARIILDSKLRTPFAARALAGAKKEKVLIFTSQKASREKRMALRRLGAKVIICGRKKVSIRRLLSLLPKLGIFSVLVEGGSEVIRSFLASRLIDRLTVAISHKKLEGSQPIFSPISPKILKMLSDAEKKRMGKDMVIEGRLR